VTDTERMTTQVEIQPFAEPIPEGCTAMGYADAMVCNYDYYETGDPDRAEGCGGIYYQRSYLTPSRLVITERTPCQCMLKIMGQKEQERNQNRLRFYKRELAAAIVSLFSGYDLMQDDAYNHMALQNFKPANEDQEITLQGLKTFQPGTDSICLYGKAGRGKTHLALGVARAAREKGSTVLALKAIDLLTRIKRTYDKKDTEAEIQIMRVMKQVDLLVIDDLGLEKSSEWVLSKFYEIIDHRHRRRTTIFTTNLTGREMEEKEGKALVSRVWGSEIRILVEGSDHRLTQGAR